MKSEAPRSFRRESRLFLSVALLLILFLNFVTLLFFRQSVRWASSIAERRAEEILRRVDLASPEGTEFTERAPLESDVLFLALYDARGRRVRGPASPLEAPALSPVRLPRFGQVEFEWRHKPALLIASLGVKKGALVAGFDPGPGDALRVYAGSLSVMVPIAGAALVVLAWLYLRGLLDPFERLLATARTAPAVPAAAGGEPEDERDFLIRRFESTITALSQKEQELERMARAEKERADDLEVAARTLASNLPTGVLSVDREGSVVELNEAGREILAIEGEIRGVSFERALAELPDLHALIAGVLRGREAIGRQEILWRHEAEERVLGVTVAPATGADGRFLGVTALFSDLSEVRRLERRMALARHLADLGEVSAGAAHEFRNAAAAIDGYADLALRNPERAPDHLKAIRREAQEMSRVTSDFLLFARPDRFVPEPVSLAGVVEAAATETERSFPDLEVLLEGDFPDVPGSAVLLRRAVANLLRNAAEATPPDRRQETGAVRLASEIAGSEVALSVSDRGPGLAETDREKVFLPFYSTKPDGAGFGLAIVARIAELHGGTVEVADRSGGGAVFTLRLPLRPRSAPAAVPPPDGEGPPPEPSPLRTSRSSA
jgi:signal transduction histidine kinase